MPSESIDGKSPFMALYNKEPDLKYLRVSGSLYFPLIDKSKRDKLSKKSTLCWFLRYSPSHKAYRCLRIDNNEIIIFRHVLFHEKSFPFQEKNSSNSNNKNEEPILNIPIED